MSKYKFVAIDLDDTLLDKDLKISERARQAISRAKDRGVLVTLSTGRMYRSALPYARELEIDLPIITYQGALVKNPGTGETLAHYPLPLDYARQVISRGKSLGYHINVYVNDNLYIEKENPHSARYEKISGIAAQPVGDLSDFLNREDPTKVLISAEEQQLDALMEEFGRKFGANVHITKSKPYFLEFSHPLATKGHALSVLAGKYGVLREEVMAVGDSYNDLEMIDYAGLGVIVANARKDLKEHADYVTAASSGDGVAEAIEKFILER
ncbi:Cof-like hydrolase [Desulfofarcimen acetoxidans DSM 771]|uniref:Cof-like hydrolase n=1 Tax=Desulfofarcimen acetoxidans (strain ATCC 49208 / DSM 771 / KCTC 5769 / VKM B-1644 / 5575) TaxID=485916 RepID=C8VY09_DESAS|nr:Cof-type HAD-IIB family hydrolase [Desulfofarcimen acetoxidans]ACV64638.1 Cof-like hydrolase [Desulfofarcimen acetoxidans DSM 771]